MIIEDTMKNIHPSLLHQDDNQELIKGPILKNKKMIFNNNADFLVIPW